MTGLGPIAGQALADHMDVDKIAFTGSSAGKRISETPEETWDHVLILCPSSRKAHRLLRCEVQFEDRYPRTRWKGQLMLSSVSVLPAHADVLAISIATD